MRPIDKKNPEEIVFLRDSQGNNELHVIRREYPDYHAAKSPLVAHLGAYCSYCELPLNERHLDVEHIEPKSLGVAYEISWSNFLLSCRTCNGMDNKGVQHILPSDMHLPHRNNTFLSFEYLPGGFVIVNRALTGVEREHAEALYNLVKLDKHPGIPNVDIATCDKRWQEREEAWHDIELTLYDYSLGEISEDALIRYAKKTGFWSMWFTQCAAYPNLRARLISDFPGTCVTCFDPKNGYAPIYRNPGKLDQI